MSPEITACDYPLYFPGGKKADKILGLSTALFAEGLIPVPQKGIEEFTGLFIAVSYKIEDQIFP